MYADDIVLISGHNSIVESEAQLERDVQRCYTWCNQNCITINKKKTQVMRMSRCKLNPPPPKLNIKIADITLEEVAEYKYLGAIFDSHMTFKANANKLIKTLNHKLYLLSRIRKHLDEEKAILFYKTMLVPYADYTSFLVDCTTSALQTKIQRLQNRGLRICRYGRMYERCSATDLHTHFKVKTLYERRLPQLLCQTFKVSKSKGMLKPPENRRTRADHKVKFKIKKFDYITMQKSPLWRGVWEWDGLNAATQLLEDKKKFSNLIKDRKHRPHMV